MINILKVCEKCEAEFVIGHNMNQRHYIIRHCTFCGEELEAEMEDELDEEYYREELDS